MVVVVVVVAVVGRSSPTQQQQADLPSLLVVTPWSNVRLARVRRRRGPRRAPTPSASLARSLRSLPTPRRRARQQQQQCARLSPATSKPSLVEAPPRCRRVPISFEFEREHEITANATTKKGLAAEGPFPLRNGAASRARCASPPSCGPNQGGGTPQRRRWPPAAERLARRDRRARSGRFGAHGVAGASAGGETSGRELARGGAGGVTGLAGATVARGKQRWEWRRRRRR